MIKCRKPVKFLFLILVIWVTTLFCPRKVLAAFSFSVTEVTPSTVDSKSQKIQVKISVSSLPSGDSYFRVGIDNNTSSIGYLNNGSSWIKLGTLVSDKVNNQCANYFKISTDGEYFIPIKIGDDNDISNGSHVVKAYRFTSTCGSYSDSSETPNLNVNINLPLPTSTPTPTPIVASSRPVGTFKIIDVVDESGNVLNEVKLYVDGQYIHHYAPETLLFGDGLYCDNDKLVACGFGTHTIKFEKSGYNSLEYTPETAINSGYYEEEGYTLIAITSETPTSTPTQKLTPTLAATLTPKPSEIPTEPEILLASENLQPTPTEGISEGEVIGVSDIAKRGLNLPLILIVSGSLLILISLGTLLLPKLKGYNRQNEPNITEIP